MNLAKLGWLVAREISLSIQFSKQEIRFSSFREEFAEGELYGLEKSDIMFKMQVVVTARYCKQGVDWA
jgi:hypothetical protein